MTGSGMQRGFSRALAAVLVALQAFAGYVVAAAQSTKVNVDINTGDGGGTAWYSTWWFWVLVGLFVLIVIVAITSRSKGTVVSK
jgi:hypothetical protein